MKLVLLYPVSSFSRCRCYMKMKNIWGALCQKQVFKVGTSNYTRKSLWDVTNCPCLRSVRLATWHIMGSYALSITRRSIHKQSMAFIDNILGHPGIIKIHQFHHNFHFIPCLGIGSAGWDLAVVCPKCLSHLDWTDPVVVCGGLVCFGLV